MKWDMSMMVALARQASDPAFGAHLLLLRDAGYLDHCNQLTDAGRAFVAGAEAAGKEKPHEIAGLFEALERGVKLGYVIPRLFPADQRPDG